MSKLQQSTIFDAAEDSSEQTGRLIKGGMGPFYYSFFKKN